VRPRGVVMLGATAGAAVFGTSFRVGASRGRPLDWPDNTTDDSTGTPWRPSWVVATTHPSAVLRSRQRDQEYAALVADLEVAGSLLASAS
jgi:uracil-DNA glycosylase